MNLNCQDSADGESALNLPSQTGSRRIAWTAIPADVRAQIERLLGKKVVSAQNQLGGFSEGLAARVRLSGGSGAFIKAANSLTAPAAAGHHRQEIVISARLPREAPVPRLLHAYDDGVWVALVFEEIPGRLPVQPWRRDELDRVLSAVTDLAQVLTPSPVDEAIVGGPRLGGWRALADDASAERLQVLPPWAARNIDRLAALEDRAAPDVGGETLLHGDLYPFNTMLTTERVFVVDWPHAWVGASHCDVVTLLSGAFLSGIDPQPLADVHPLTRNLDPERIDGVLALHSGFLLRTALSAGQAADPHILDMMVALGLSSLRWLRSRVPDGDLG